MYGSGLGTGKVSPSRRSAGDGLTKALIKVSSTFVHDSSVAVLSSGVDLVVM